MEAQILYWFLIVYVVSLVAVWPLASYLGRRGFLWFLLGGMISPFLVAIALIIAGKTPQKKAEER